MVMNFHKKNPPRIFEVAPGVVHKDCGQMELKDGEQITFKTESGAEYDVARMSWGFYATPSLNGRLKRFNLRGVLVKNLKGQFFILLVEKDRELEFNQYLKDEKHSIVCWLDEDHSLQELERKCLKNK
jgi:hypothetical protein